MSLTPSLLPSLVTPRDFLQAAKAKEDQLLAHLNGAVEGRDFIGLSCSTQIHSTPSLQSTRGRYRRCRRGARPLYSSRLTLLQQAGQSSSRCRHLAPPPPPLLQPLRLCLLLQRLLKPAQVPPRP
jgi:hypothetical protein